MSLPIPLGPAARLRLLWRRLRSRVEPYSADEPAADSFRARQLQAVLRLTPLTMAANGINAALVVSAFHDGGPTAFLALWCTALAVVVSRGLRAWQRWRRRPGQWARASPRAMRRAVWSAGALALLWALVPLVLFPAADGPQQLLVATITTGMMCAGGFALATVPLAGSVYVVVLGTAAAVALVQADFALALPVGLLLLIYTVIVLVSVWATARLYGARLLAEIEAERHNEVVGLLLRDFEEHASDLLWEIDPQGRLRHVSPRLVALLRLDAEQIQTVPALDLLERATPGDAAASASLDALRQHLHAGAPFRDLPLATRQKGQTHWWSLSAKPLRDANGHPVGWRGVARDVTEARRANTRLTWLAHFDELTGVANRHHLRDQLAELLSAQPMSPFAVLCLDLDHFKTTNDTLGHAVGDALLKEVAHRLQARSRRTDTVARLGGDEFAIVLREVGTAAEVDRVAHQLLEGLQAPCEVQGAAIAVRASIGAALAPDDGQDIDTLLNHADLALYAAKQAGRGEVRFFTQPMAAVTRRRLLIEQALREALARDELQLAFQPQVRMGDWRVTGMEALLRWRHPVLGDVSPAEFVPVAEEAGLIQEIGRWVLQQACRHAVRWPAEVRLAVNVSPAQSLSADLLRAVLAALRASGLPASRLELEITESIFVGETQAALQVLHALRDAGIQIALDDFGTGYSALSYLRRFPFDTLKIDHSFVRELLQRRDARAIVKMITGLARTLGMSIIAEGVEEPAQAEVLQRYGCSGLQGYLVARPMPAAEVTAFLTAWPHRARVQRATAPATDLLPLGPER